MRWCNANMGLETDAGDGLPFSSWNTGRRSMTHRATTSDFTVRVRLASKMG